MGKNDSDIELNVCFGCMKELQEGQHICPSCGYDNSAPASQEDVLPAGTVLSRKYLIGKVLGRGGFGITYLGFDLDLQVKVAIKEYFPLGVCMRSSQSYAVYTASAMQDTSAFSKGSEVFLDEARTLAGFNSPGIVHVRDFFREHGTAYIVMDFIEGKTLKDVMIQNGGRIGPDRLISLMKPLIIQLDELHEKNIIHRDIKPDNIMLVKDRYGEHLVLLDFGTARTYVSNETKTMTGVVTQGFSPLEQYSQKSRQGPYTDVYALCATMYCTIAGIAPPTATERSADNTPIKPFSSFDIMVAPQTEQAIMHGLALKSSDRTQTMRELLEELEAPIAAKAELSSTGKTENASQGIKKEQKDSNKNGKKLIEEKKTPKIENKGSHVLPLAAVIVIVLFVIAVVALRGISSSPPQVSSTPSAAQAPSRPEQTAEMTEPSSIPSMAQAPSSSELTTETPKTSETPVAAQESQVPEQIIEIPTSGETQIAHAVPSEDDGKNEDLLPGEFDYLTVFGTQDGYRYNEETQQWVCYEEYVKKYSNASLHIGMQVFGEKESADPKYTALYVKILDQSGEIYQDVNSIEFDIGDDVYSYNSMVNTKNAGSGSQIVLGENGNLLIEALAASRVEGITIEIRTSTNNYRINPDITEFTNSIKHFCRLYVDNNVWSYCLDPDFCMRYELRYPLMINGKKAVYSEITSDNTVSETNQEEQTVLSENTLSEFEDQIPEAIEMDADYDLGTMRVSELLALRDTVDQAIVNWEGWKEVNVPNGTWKVGEAIPEGKWTVKVGDPCDVWLKVGTTLNDLETDLTGNYEYWHLRGPQYSIYNEGDISSVDLQLKEKDIVIVEEGYVLFTPFIGKLHLSFYGDHQRMENADADTIPVNLNTLSFENLVNIRSTIDRYIWSAGEWDKVKVPNGVWTVGEDIPEGKWTVAAGDPCDVWLKVGTTLNDLGTDLTGNYEYWHLRGPQHIGYRESDITSVDLQLRKGHILVADEGFVVFTSSNDKPSLGFDSGSTDNLSS